MKNRVQILYHLVILIRNILAHSNRAITYGSVYLNFIIIGDEVVLSKMVLSNFRPKQANKWIGDPRGSIIELFLLS